MSINVSNARWWCTLALYMYMYMYLLCNLLQHIVYSEDIG